MNASLNQKTPIKFQALKHSLFTQAQVTPILLRLKCIPPLSIWTSHLRGGLRGSGGKCRERGAVVSVVGTAAGGTGLGMEGREQV